MPKKYEYDYLMITRGRDVEIEVFNKLGAQGFALVGSLQVIVPGDRFTQLIFMREVSNGAV